MELTIEQALQQGKAAHNEGKLQKAERFYRAILQSQPTHPDANHNLGVIAVSVNKAGEALPLFKRAIEANPKIDQFWLSYMDALIKENQLETVKKVLAEGRKMGLVGEKVDALQAQIRQTKDANLPEQKTRLTFAEKRKEASVKKKKKRQNTNRLKPSQQQLSILVQHYQNRQYDEAEKLAISITEQFPKNEYSWKVLGAVFEQKGRMSDALGANQKAVALAPKDAAAHSILGNTLRKLDRLEEAETSFRQAIALKPAFAEAHSNLGITLQDLGRLKNAETSYRQAIAFKPGFAEAYSNLGITLQDLGRLEEAEASYRQAIALKSDFAGAMLKLSIVQDYMNNLDEAILQLENILKIDVDNYGLKAAVNLAIFRFLEGDFTTSKMHLLASSKIQKRLDFEFNNFRIYQEYLLNILSWHENKSPNSIDSITDKKLYVIGESHALISHQLRVQRSGNDFLCKSFLIQGCMQWALGNSIRNQYKTKFEGIIRSLPKSSEILLAIGEIDCRLDIGIINHRSKYPQKNIKELIATTIENYFYYIDTVNSCYGHKIIIQGVPCPNIETKNIAKEKIMELIDVIREFNVELKSKSKEMGFGFLDLYKLTDRGDGFSNDIWHLDHYHLSAEGMCEAWREYSFDSSSAITFQ